MAVPLLAIFVPLEIAAPLAVLLSITIAGIVVVQDWRKIHVRSVVWLVGATVVGIPVGVWLLTGVYPRVVKGVLAVVIIGFSVYSLMGRKGPEVRGEGKGWLLGCGFVAGVFGGAYGMNGPPLAIYGAMRRWSAQEFRATLQGYFLPASVMGMVGYWLAGLWVPAVTRYYWMSLPAMVPAIFLGRAINHRMKGEGFLKLVYVGLVGIGGVLLVEAVRGTGHP